MDEKPDFSGEMEIYASLLGALIDRGGEGKYLVVGLRRGGEEYVNVFDTYESAIRDGHARFGIGPFLVKQIARTEPVYNL